jgi:hypothetical protein
MTDIGQSPTIIGELEEQSGSYRDGPLPPLGLPLRVESIPRLHVSIPTFKAPLPSDSATPKSESPLTPASLSSPIAGVVDLTNRVKTISSGPVAHGGLSDIYKGERYSSGSGEDDGDETILVRILESLMCPFNHTTYNLRWLSRSSVSCPSKIGMTLAPGR